MTEKAAKQTNAELIATIAEQLEHGEHIEVSEFRTSDASEAKLRDEWRPAREALAELARRIGTNGATTT